jgi:hypothetical protein
MTRLVRQRERTDCGVACLAMVAPISYEEAFATFCHLGLDKKRKARPFSSNFKDLTRAMQAHGLGCHQRRWSGWGAFSGLGVIKVRSRTKSRDWHWVVAESHPQYGFILRDPGFELAGILRPPDRVPTQDPARYEPYGNWLEIVRSGAMPLSSEAAQR